MKINSTKKIRELSLSNKENNVNISGIMHIFFALLMLTTPLLAQEKHTVTGKVTGATENAGIPGANVIIKGTSTGTSTDTDGNFKIEAAENDVLVISYIGYESQEVTVGNKTILNVAIVEDISKLNEVVVVGYGQMKRSTITGAQTSVKAADIEKTVNTTIEQAIQGRAAGVYITQNSGQPGGGISVNIRGVNSINGSNEPLYVVDGVQMQQNEAVTKGVSASSNPLAGLNPSDIESIEVLQGPSATAIYGSRGTNGVLLITTKRGKAGDVKVSYGYQYSLQTPPKSLEVLKLNEYAQMVNEYHDISGGDPDEALLDPSLLGAGTDWQKELFNSAPMNKHQLSLSGGSEKTTYFLSGEYLKQNGVATGSGFDRYSLRLNVDNKARKWLTIGANFNFNQTNEKLTTSQENIISTALKLSPLVPVKNFDGTWGGDDDANGVTQYSPVNPIAIATLTTNDLVRRQILGGLNLGIDIIEGLTFRTSVNTNLGFSSSTYFVPTYEFGKYNRNSTNSLTERRGTNTYWNWNQLLEYSKQIDKHYFSLMVSHEAQESTWETVSAGRTTLPVNDVLFLGLGDKNTQSTDQTKGDWAMESFLGRLNYNYGERYILMGTLRADGSANFGRNNRWGIFPSLSAAWRVSKEAFFNVPAINELKIRFETGTTGNQGGGGFTFSKMTPYATPNGTGFLPSRYKNEKLQWEETKTNNIGFNLALFQNRIQIEGDYYVKSTENLLMEKPLPWFMGSNGTGAVSSQYVNLGSLENKGWGITLSTVNLDKAGFKWESNFNISGFKTTIKEFYSDAAFASRTSWWMNDWEQRSAVGQAPWLFRGYIEDGLYQSVEDLENSALPVDNSGNELKIEDSPQGVWVGDVKFKDISGPEGTPDGIIDSRDQTNIGNPWPKFFAGFTNTFSYKGFILSVLLTSSYGNDVYNYVARENTNPNNIYLSWNLLKNTMNYAKLGTDDEGNTIITNTGTNVPRVGQSANGNFTKHTNKWVEDGSYIKIKNISLRYAVPTELLSKQKFIKGVIVSLSAQNVKAFTKYKGYDPEIGAYVGANVDPTNQAIGLDNGRYPLTPVYSFSLGVDF